MFLWAYENRYLLLDTINPNIYFLIIKCHKSLNRLNLDQGRAVPPYNILGYLTIRQADRVIVRYALPNSIRSNPVVNTGRKTNWDVPYTDTQL